MNDLYDALKELLEQVESLEDYKLTRDMEPHKAQFCWDRAIGQAKMALGITKEAA